MSAVAALNINVDANDLLRQIGSLFPGGQSDYHRQQLPDKSIFVSFQSDGSLHAFYWHPTHRHRVSVVPGTNAKPVRSWADAGKTAYVAHAVSKTGGNTSHYHVCAIIPCNECGN